MDGLITTSVLNIVQCVPAVVHAQRQGNVCVTYGVICTSRDIYNGLEYASRLLHTDSILQPPCVFFFWSVAWEPVKHV